MHGGEVGFEDPACGEKRSATLVRKEMKKEEKKHIFTYMPTNKAMAAAGLVRLDVTLPLNVSLDLGSVSGAQHNLAIIDTDHLLVTCYGRSQGPMTLGREMPLTCQKGQE